MPPLGASAAAAVAARRAGRGMRQEKPRPFRSERIWRNGRIGYTFAVDPDSNRPEEEAMRRAAAESLRRLKASKYQVKRTGPYVVDQVRLWEPKSFFRKGRKFVNESWARTGVRASRPIGPFVLGF